MTDEELVFNELKRLEETRPAVCLSAQLSPTTAYFVYTLIRGALRDDRVPRAPRRIGDSFAGFLLEGLRRHSPPLAHAAEAMWRRLEELRPDLVPPSCQAAEEVSQVCARDRTCDSRSSP